MKVSLVRVTADPELLAGEAAAMCYNGKNPMRSLEVALEGGHESVMEHASFTFLIEGISRVTLAQLTRHRLASFSVQSQRYVGANLDVVIPETMKKPELREDVLMVLEAVEHLYNKAIGLGVPAEDARYFTLQAGKTQLYMTMNMRELLHFLSLRECSRAQWEIRELAHRIHEICEMVAPKIFRDAGPECARTRCPEGKKSCGKPWKKADPNHSPFPEGMTQAEYFGLKEGDSHA